MAQLPQTALDYGADDLDGTVRHELIYHDAGATTPEELTVEQLKGLIREAGREPVERDTVYNEVIKDADNPRTGASEKHWASVYNALLSGL